MKALVMLTGVVVSAAATVLLWTVALHGGDEDRSVVAGAPIDEGFSSAPGETAIAASRCREALEHLYGPVTQESLAQPPKSTPPPPQPEITPDDLPRECLPREPLSAPQGSSSGAYVVVNGKQVQIPGEARIVTGIGEYPVADEAPHQAPVLTVEFRASFVTFNTDGVLLDARVEPQDGDALSKLLAAVEPR